MSKENQRERKQASYTVFTLLPAPHTAIRSSISCTDLCNCIPEDLGVQQLAFGPKETAGNCGQPLEEERPNQEKRTKGEPSSGWHRSLICPLFLS